MCADGGGVCVILKRDPIARLPPSPKEDPAQFIFNYCLLVLIAHKRVDLA